MLDLVELFVGYLALEYVDFSILYNRSVALAKHLDTLSGRVCSLVELTGQELNGEHTLVCCEHGKLIKHLVNRRLREYCGYCLIKILLGELFCVITVDYAHILHRFDTESNSKVGKSSLSVNCELWFFLDINSINCHFVVSSVFSEQAAMARSLFIYSTGTKFRII